MKLVLLIGACVSLLYVLWIYYLAVMSLKRARDNGTLTKTAKLLGTPILWIGISLDLIVNVFVLSFLLLDPPKEWLVTDRMKRYLASSGWRSKVASWFCINLLTPFDKGHCQ